MSVSVDEESFWLGDWRVEPPLSRIVRGEEVTKIDPRNMKVLQLLASKPGQVFSQAEIEDAVWSDVIVTSNSVYQSIAQLRRALGDEKRSSRYIETIPRGGYRAVAQIKLFELEPDTVDDRNRATPPPVLNSRSVGRRFVLGSSFALISLALIGTFLVSSGARRHVPQVATELSSSDASGHVPIKAAMDNLIAAPTNRAAPRLLVDLGHTALNQGRWKDAREYFQQALDIERKRVGDKHPLVGNLLSELANVSVWGYDYEAAETYARAALSAFERMPETYDQRIMATRYLGYILLESGRYTEAEAYLLRSLELSRQVTRDTSSSTTAILLTHLSVLRYSQGRLGEAEDLARQSLNKLRQLFGEEVPQSRASLSLSATLIAQARFEEAKREAESNLAMLHGLFTEDHAYIIAARDMLGKSLIGLKEHATAEDVLRRNVDLWRRNEGMTQRVAASLSALGEALLGQGRIIDAEECLVLASREIDGSTKAREEQQWFLEHNVRLEKLQLARDRLSTGEAQLTDARG